MKQLLLPNESDFSLQPPAQLMWMKKEFDPRIENGLKYDERLRSSLRVFDDEYSRFMMLGVRDITIGKRQGSTDKTPSFSVVGMNELVVEVNFFDPNIFRKGTSNGLIFFRMHMPIDGGLYIIPYLFRIRRFIVPMFGTMTMEGIQVIPERWKRLKDMGLIKNVGFRDMHYAGGLPITSLLE